MKHHGCFRDNGTARHRLTSRHWVGHVIYTGFQREKFKQGHAEAQHKLGSSYYDGIGIKRDFDQAIYWAKHASDQDHQAAKKLMIEVEELKATSYDITLW